MNDYLHIIRTIHVISGSLWIGEIAVINFILIPAIAIQSGEIRIKFIQTIFPKNFRMASKPNCFIGGVICIKYLRFLFSTN